MGKTFENEWRYEAHPLINITAIKTHSNKKIVADSLKRLNELLIDSIENLNLSTKKRYYWDDLREVLIFNLIKPDFVDNKYFKFNERGSM